MTQAPDTTTVTLKMATKIDDKLHKAGATVPVPLSLAQQLSRDDLIEPPSETVADEPLGDMKLAAAEADVQRLMAEVAAATARADAAEAELAKALNALEAVTRQAAKENADGASPPSASEAAQAPPKKGAGAKKA